MTQEQQNSLSKSIVTDSSRYKNINIINEYNNYYVYNDIIKTTYAYSDNDKYYIITDDNIRLEQLANTYYGNSKLWYVIAEANNIDNPFVLELGQSLRIPTITNN